MKKYIFEDKNDRIKFMILISELTDNNSGLHFFLQISHHPPVSAFHITNRHDGFSINGSILAKSKFYGKTEIQP